MHCPSPLRKGTLTNKQNKAIPFAYKCSLWMIADQFNIPFASRALVRHQEGNIVSWSDTTNSPGRREKVTGDCSPELPGSDEQPRPGRGPGQGQKRKGTKTEKKGQDPEFMTATFDKLLDRDLRFCSALAPRSTIFQWEEEELRVKTEITEPTG